MLPAQRALISVYEKTGVRRLARGLNALGIEVLSTGGTKRHLEEAGIPVTPVSEVTDHPEILGGRVKTLHPRIHGGILADRQHASHRAELDGHGIGMIDLVIVNLYPFRETVASGASFAEVIEMIDIGGPTMIRAAAKNFGGVTVIVDPADYEQVLGNLERDGRVVPEPLRRSLAVKAFRATHSYDAAISTWFAHQTEDSAETLADQIDLSLTKDETPRYGENPHQQAAIYRHTDGNGVFGGYQQLQGKTVSYNNLLDTDAARKLVAFFEQPTVAIIKHNNPCGVGTGPDLATAYSRALECDPVSAFGSVIAVNRPVDGAFAAAAKGLFIEVLTAPGFDREALEVLARKKQLRLLQAPVYSSSPEEIELRSIEGGFLAQTVDSEATDLGGWQCVTERQPTEKEMAALTLAWNVCRAVKSNAIVVAAEDRTLGIGAGQMSRVDSCRLAIGKANQALGGSVAASDAFFPFRDGVDELAAAGVEAIVQPGGSKRDAEVIAAADQHGIAMITTSTRHFRH